MGDKKCFCFCLNGFHFSFVSFGFNLKSFYVKLSSRHFNMAYRFLSYVPSFLFEGSGEETIVRLRRQDQREALESRPGGPNSLIDKIMSKKVFYICACVYF